MYTECYFLETFLHARLTWAETVMLVYDPACIEIDHAIVHVQLKITSTNSKKTVKTLLQ
jgi:hypothetical protein